MRARSTTPPRPNAFTIIELQVAMVLLGIALAGVVPLVVIQSKQVKRIENRLDDNTTYYLAPPPERWAARLGAGAVLLDAPPAPRPPAPVMLIDDGDPGYAETGTDWNGGECIGAYGDDRRYNFAGPGGETAVWQFTGLTPGWYEVFATWLEFHMLSTDVTYAVYDGATLLGTFSVNQQLPPGGAVVGGRPWHAFGAFEIQGDTLRVELTRNAGQGVRADAARIAPVKNELTLSAVEKTLDSEETAAHVTVTIHIPP